MTNSLGETDSAWRLAFADAAAWFVSVAGSASGRLAEPALGEWTVRDLLGHTSRALSTVSTYLAAYLDSGLDTGADGADGGGPVEVDSAAEYWRRGLASADHAAVADRGRTAGADLGPDPATAVADLVARVSAEVDAADGDTRVATPFGVMTLAEYLPTRTFELAVHTCDLAAALGLPLDVPAPALRTSLAVAGALAGPTSGELLLALTGRRSLPAGYTVLAAPPS
jgi:uncharacterized protein (TIGR03083 family)